MVVSNPPYIPVGAVPVDPEVRDHDPALALYGGSADGLAIPLAVAARAAVLLREGGVLVMEHADSQGASLPAALRATGLWGDVLDSAISPVGPERRWRCAQGRTGDAPSAGAFTSRARFDPRLGLMSPVFDCTTEPGRADAIPKAAAGVRAGSLVVMPTDTLYGIGADAFSPDAVHDLLAAKGRGSDMPPPVLVPSGTHGRRARDGRSRLRAGAGGRLLAPAVDHRPACPAVPDVGPRRHRGSGRPADAGRPGCAGAVARGGADGGEQREPHRPPGIANRRRGGQPARCGRRVLPRRRARHQVLVDVVGLHTSTSR